MNIEKDTLIYDIETYVPGNTPNPEKDRLRLFGCYSYKTNKYYILKDKNDIRKIINAHKYLVGFNTCGYKGETGYDNEVLKREGITWEYKIDIDLMAIIKERVGAMKIKKGFLNNLLMDFKLDTITKVLDLVDEDSSKIKIDYDMFKKESWTLEEENEIKIYLKRDIEVTKKLYEWIEDYFWSFRDFLLEEDVRKKVYLKASIAKFAYKAICKALGWQEEYGNVAGDKGLISGGYVAYPAGERFEGDIYCLDYNCLIKDTMVTCIYPNNNNRFKKKIQELKVGDCVISNNKEKNYVSMLKEQKYEGEVIEIETIKGHKIVCTPQHRLPVYDKENDCIVDKFASEISFNDEIITKYSKFGKINGNYSNAIEQRKCVCCGKDFTVFQSSVTLCCSLFCSNKMKSINNSFSNLGKTKETHEHLKKMSKERKGKKRDLDICYRIAVATNKGTQNNYANGKYKYKDVCFKSENEMKVAQSLDRDNIKWEYQPKVFKLNNTTYTPDFYLPEWDKWLEVKGKTLEKGNNQYKKFLEFFKTNKNSIIFKANDVKKIKEMLKNEN